MSAGPDTLDELATRLDRAAVSGSAIPQLGLHERMDEQAAYEVQHRVVRLREERGDPVIGMKLGFTNQAKAAQMGVFDVIAGSLTAGMRVGDGEVLDLGGLIHPRVEPELAFLLRRDVDLSGGAETPFTEAVAAVAPALEIIDSRYRDFSFSLQDVIADNTSASRFVLGPWVPLGGPGDCAQSGALDARGLANLGVSLDIDGEVAATGSTAAILGHPVRAYDACCRMARRFGFALPAGSILLAGAATVAVPLAGATTAAVRVARVGSASLRVSKGDE
ncbi:2-keto-4-pentenoate hydratase [Leucobacter triazinivorans]|uniref:4-oxalocrotonate decarboxylase n=1 Tax=Leucobacter triazinivorans TaxID=1784719 RepID=A0A4P6KCU6_9MICO|nr:4-oxalocrotonate decarboxylase [Leucobacter triazinivorans]QBE47963.1 4-oxalocrotonate decarboxylase [Leucobacter triazinivorans]